MLGFGVLLPGEVTMSLEMRPPAPHTELISETGTGNGELSATQGGFQLVIVAVMVWLRWGGF